MPPIRWYEVKCSALDESFGVRYWSELIEFMTKTSCYDYVITGHTTKPFTGVNWCLLNGNIISMEGVEQ